LNKVAIVTGGSSGIGKAVSLALAAAGYSLIIVGRTSHYINAAIDQLNTQTPVSNTMPHLGLSLDVTNEDDMREMAEKTMDMFGRIDLLVASAGIGKKAGSERVIPYSTATLPLDEWKAVIGVNLTGTFLSNRAVLAPMMSQRSGHIINICSSTTPHGLHGTPYAQAYSASKFGVVGFTESLAEEMASFGVRVQAVFPGAVETPLVDNTMLARPFGGAIAVDNFATTIMQLVAQTEDSTVTHPHVIPFRGAFENDRTG
jgi:NAD(P)-dependent dehydrogenase (short-subunit alcohol dehydrogenase family)